MASDNSDGSIRMNATTSAERPLIKEIGTVGGSTPEGNESERSLLLVNKGR